MQKLTKHDIMYDDMPRLTGMYDSMASANDNVQSFLNLCKNLTINYLDQSMKINVYVTQEFTNKVVRKP